MKWLVGGAVSAQGTLRAALRKHWSASTREEEIMRKHVVLLGDSILDNGAYVGSGAPVIQQVREMLPRGDEATLLAVDGHYCGNVVQQLTKLPPDATHLVISVGGNDALAQSALLQEPATSFAQVLARLHALGEEFAADYRAMLQTARSHNLPLLVCTIYDANFPDAAMQRIIRAALTHFNDRILREAFAAGVPLLDLRLICDESADYANEIEPSSRGGEKIAAAMLFALAQHDFSARHSTIFRGASAAHSM